MIHFTPPMVHVSTKTKTYIIRGLMTTAGKGKGPYILLRCIHAARVFLAVTFARVTFLWVIFLTVEHQISMRRILAVAP